MLRYGLDFVRMVIESWWLVNMKFMLNVTPVVSPSLVVSNLGKSFFPDFPALVITQFNL